MIVLSGANTALLRITRAVILWLLAFLIGPWPALACIIHCLQITQPDTNGVAFFVCDAPHAPASHPLPPPPVRYEMVGLSLTFFIAGLAIIQRLIAAAAQPFASLNVTPDPPPPRARLERPVRLIG